MPDLKTRYLGLTLRNPLIAGSCTHTIKPDAVRALADAGVGAVVLKSIFEEQIRAGAADMYAALEGDVHPEALEYLRADLPMRLGPASYLDRIREIKAAVDVPVIASVNCAHGEQWLDFAEQIQAAGADALELNIYDIVTDAGVAGADVEERHVAVVRVVCSALRIPVAVKLGPFYASFANVAQRMVEAGAAGLVLFNRFLQPDIDVDGAVLKFRLNLSRAEDLLLPLRWVAILRGQMDTDLALSTGVHGGEDAAKALLAGASAVQVCSALYSGAPAAAVRRILVELEAWMARHGYASLKDCRGLALTKSPRAAHGFERAQYVRALVGLE